MNPPFCPQLLRARNRRVSQFGDMRVGHVPIMAQRVFSQ